MTTLREAAQQALEALEADCGGRCNAEYNPCWQREVAETLRAALAEPVQTPHLFPLQSDRMRIDPVTGNVGIGTPSAEPVQEPVAWSYELATTMLEHGYDGWEHRITRYKPNVPEGSIRNLTPLYTAPPQRPSEPVQEPAAIVGTQADTWKGYEGQWLPPGPPIKTVHMLRELPEGTLLYAAPPQRKED